MNSRLLDIFTTNATLSTKMVYNNRVMLIYLYFTSGRISTRVTINDGDHLILVLPFSNPRFVPNMYSYAMMSYLVTGKSCS